MAVDWSQIGNEAMANLRAVVLARVGNVADEVQANLGQDLAKLEAAVLRYADRAARGDALAKEMLSWIGTDAELIAARYALRGARQAQAALLDAATVAAQLLATVLKALIAGGLVV